MDLVSLKGFTGLLRHLAEIERPEGKIDLETFIDRNGNGFPTYDNLFLYWTPGDSSDFRRRGEEYVLFKEENPELDGYLTDAFKNYLKDSSGFKDARRKFFEGVEALLYQAYREMNESDEKLFS